jgi:hypothetical protein
MEDRLRESVTSGRSRCNPKCRPRPLKDDEDLRRSPCSLQNLSVNQQATPCLPRQDGTLLSVLPLRQLS